MTETVNLDPPSPTLLTHKGWFGICPIYMGDVHSNGPVIVERHWSLMPLMQLSHWLQVALIFIQSLLFENDDLVWIVVQGDELDSPKWLMSDGSVQ